MPEKITITITLAIFKRKSKEKEKIYAKNKTLSVVTYNAIMKPDQSVVTIWRPV